MYHEDGEPVEVWFADDDEQYCTGFIVTIGKDFVLIARLSQGSWLNGLRAIRLTAIEEILPADDTEFILRDEGERSTHPAPGAVSRDDARGAT